MTRAVLEINFKLKQANYREEYNNTTDFKDKLGRNVK